ncbi:hypothetical protein GCM10010298_68200 [Streptomyces microflavus]|nr:hypothetical protein GCM10010298_68200 [Streptomyces microflavus]
MRESKSIALRRDVLVPYACPMVLVRECSGCDQENPSGIDQSGSSSATFTPRGPRSCELPNPHSSSRCEKEKRQFPFPRRKDGFSRHNTPPGGQNYELNDARRTRRIGSSVDRSGVECVWDRAGA